MPAEETLLDPPVTPAPIFAYRALKGWFVGSPDSSPERDNKENISLHAKSIHGARSLSVPNLSPQRRKRDSGPVVSPTKSILRTPGATTPRAKSLREINVKFKSVSPDVRRKDPCAGGRKGNPAGSHEGATKQDAKALAKPLAAKTAQPAAKVEPQLISHAAPILGTDLDEHFRRTEKEMKRLVRYGQKWREVARQKDEENTRLRLLLEEAQGANRRLETLLSKSEWNLEGAKTIGTMAQTHGKDISGKSVAGRSVAATEAATRDRKSACVDTTVNAAAHHIEELLDLTPPPEPTDLTMPAPQRSASAPTTATFASSINVPTKLSANQNPSQPRTTNSKPSSQRPASISTSVPLRSPLTALQHRIEGSFLSVTDTVARTNLPVDRIAAVRKRLMAKEQARKAGLSVLDEVGVGEVGAGWRRGIGVTGAGREIGFQEDAKSKQGQAEESVVDWAGI